MGSIKTTTIKETDEKFEELFEIKSEINLLKRDAILFADYIKRIDAGMEKIGDLTNSMHTMIKLHEERISQQIIEDNSMKALVEQRRLESNEGFKIIAESVKELSLKVDGVNTKLTAKIDAFNEKIWKLDFLRAAIVATITLFSAGLFSGWFSNFFKTIHIFGN